MDKKAIAWLYQQLPELVNKGVLPQQSADALKNHYGTIDGMSGRRTMLTVFGIMGTSLVGLGIILLLAHNWEQLTRVTRLLISVGLLVSAQAVAAGVLWWKRDSVAWNEGAGTFLLLMIGVVMALVGQTYHLSDDTGGFLLTWMLLSLPVVYLMRAFTPALFYMVGITAWMTEGWVDIIGKHLIWVLMGLWLPYYWQQIKMDRFSAKTVVLSWALIISVYLSFGMAFDKYIDHFGVLMYAAWFSLTFMTGILWFNGAEKSWRKPFQVMGFTGIVGLAFILTFKDIWPHMVSQMYTSYLLEVWLTVKLLALTAIGIVLLRKHKQTDWVYVAVMPFVAGLSYWLQQVDSSGVTAAVVMNVYFLFISLLVIKKGIREGSVGGWNGGMLLFSALVGARFLDGEFSFVVRGIVFIVLGICFLLANWVLVRRKGGGVE